MGEALKLKLSRLVDSERRLLIEDQDRWVASRNGQCDRPDAISVKSCVLQLTKIRIATFAAANGGASRTFVRTAPSLRTTTRHAAVIPKSQVVPRHVTIPPKDHGPTRHVTVTPKEHTPVEHGPITPKKVTRSNARGGASSQGVASYYDRDSETASGEKFDPHKLTAAHPTLPFGTRVRVTNMSNGKSVVVRVNDRGPFVRGRIVDVSSSAAEALRMTEPGVVNVKLDIVH
jgi:rare lipoprotein A